MKEKVLNILFLALIPVYMSGQEEEKDTIGSGLSDQVYQDADKNKEDVTELQDVVVIGYGSAKKADLTGSNVVVKGDAISRQPNTSAVSSLQGKSAGVQVTTSGKPGESPLIKFRGSSSSQKESTPLFVVDGVWMDNLDAINPNDIESMVLLKDASSAAIYGIRAAAGVVIVKTKTGKLNQKVQVSYDGYVGLQTAMNNFPMANRDQYVQLNNEKNYGKEGYVPLDANKLTDVNWFNEVSRPAFMQSHSLSMMGGNEYSTYNLNLGYVDQEGVLEGEEYNRTNIRFGNRNNLSKSIRVGIDANLSLVNQVKKPTDIFNKAYMAPPIISPAQKADGTFTGFDGLGIGYDGANPVAALYYTDEKYNQKSLNSQLYAEFDILKKLTFRTSIGINYYNGFNKAYTPIYFVSSKQKNEQSSLAQETSTSENWQFENILTYKDTFADKHNLTVMLGQGSYQEYLYKIKATVKDVPADSKYFHAGDYANAEADDEGTLSKKLSYFARGTYDYEGKYLLSATIRRDGSSDFSEGNRTEYFPSVGAGWVISKESFFENVRAVSFLKIKASWGKLGNSRVPNNAYTKVTTPGYSIIGGELVKTETINSTVPAEIKWEIVEEGNVGLESTYVDNRLSLDLDFYKRTTSNAIFEQFVPGYLGSSNDKILGNFGTIQNKGIEIALGWKDQLGGGFSYNINGNFSYNQNELTYLVPKIDLADGAVPNGYFSTWSPVGQPIGSFYGYEVEKIDPNGKFVYKDLNNDGAINESDRKILGSSQPKYMYGLNLGCSFKGFDFSTDVYGLAGFSIYNYKRSLRFGDENWDQDFYNNHWTASNTNTMYPDAGSLNGAKPSSFFVEDGSFLKIRAMQLGYTFSKSVLSVLKMQKIRLYTNVQNLATFTNYNGFNPEITELKNVRSANIDNQTYPQIRTFNLGVSATF